MEALYLSTEVLFDPAVAFCKYSDQDLSLLCLLALCFISLTIPVPSQSEQY